MGAVDSFIVLLSAREVVTSEQLRQTLVYKFMPATSILQKKTNDPSKEGNKSLFQAASRVTFRICSGSGRIFQQIEVFF